MRSASNPPGPLWRLALATACLPLALGCGRGKAPETPSPGSPATSGPATPKDGSLVLFSVEWDPLQDAPTHFAVPLACYDAREKKRKSGEACLALVPPGSTLGLSTGGHSVSREVGLCSCHRPGETSSSLVLADAPDDQPLYAFWPETAGALLTPPAPWLDPPAKPSPEERARLEEAVRAARGASDPKSATETLYLLQRASADLDGDGVTDTLYSVKLSPTDDPYAPGALFFGLFLANGRDAGPLVLLEKGALSLQGLLDLDGDKRPELLLSLSTSEGPADTTDTILLGLSGTPETLGHWRCTIAAD